MEQEINPVQNPNSVNPQLPHKHLHPGIWIAVLVVATLIVGYLLWANVSKEWPFAGENQKSGIVNRGKKADETATWKTYYNDKYGIQFKYPSDFILTEGFVTGDLNKPASWTLRKSSGKVELRASYSIVSSGTEKPFADTDNAQHSSYKSSESAVIDGRAVTIVYLKEKGVIHTDGDYTIGTYFRENNKDYTFLNTFYEEDASQLKNAELFKSFISTFKLTR